jgi:lysophospholipid acyltransferase (LPLAT)-like uncharacterized protein
MSSVSPNLSARLERSRRRLLEWLAIHFFGGFVLRLLVATWRLEDAVPEHVLQALAAGKHFIYVFWHNRQIGFIKIHQRYTYPVKVMVSRHGDGEIIARIVTKYGIGSVRGSSTRGGSAALKELITATAEGHVAITPDGPVGPRYQLKQGAVLLASRSGLPVLCVGWSADRVWRFRSWDRFLLPKPFARLKVTTEGPVEIPADLDADGLEEARLDLERRTNELTARLDREMGQEVDAKLHRD